MQSGFLNFAAERQAAGRCCGTTSAQLPLPACGMRPRSSLLISARAFGLAARHSHHRGGASIVCMAEPRRVARVSKQLEREIGSLLLYDKVLQKAVCPERRRGLDSAASAIASVTEVRISNDLQVAKVYLSIFSDAQGKAAAMDQLVKLQGYVRKKIGASMNLRLTPEIRFIYDEANERGERVLKLLKQIKLQEQGLVEPPPIAFPWATVREDEEADEEDPEADEDSDSEETEGFFDEEEYDAESQQGSPSSFGQSKGLAIAADEQPEPDRSFFGFEDPGGALAAGETWAGEEEESDQRLLATMAAADSSDWGDGQGTAGEQKGRKRRTQEGGSKR